MEAARPATPADLPTVARLWEDVLAETAPQRGGAFLVDLGHRPPPLVDALRADLDDPDRRLVCGTFDEEVLGFAAARLVPAVSPGRRPTCFVEILYVVPEAREVGVGEAIMDEVTAWAVERDCGGVDASALPGARAAKAFFETSGLVTRLLVMHRPLP